VTGTSRPSRIRTLGHGTLSAEDFVALARQVPLDAVVDVRRYPGSRRHPQFASEAMAAWLPEHEVGYAWMSSLGGRRRPVPDSPNTGLRNEQFRAYADHMDSDEFRTGVDELLAFAASRDVAVMCAESLWWRCHRRLLADHLVLIDGIPVDHVFHDGRVVEHVPTAEAEPAGDHVVYPPQQLRLLPDEGSGG
jgi:uncharacterized protein (DUF488 family)